jgi:muconate cycloisomerase
VQLAEGSFGKLLLREDLTAKPIRFGFGGRWKPMSGPGVGVSVDTERLRRFALQPPLEIPF